MELKCCKREAKNDESLQLQKDSVMCVRVRMKKKKKKRRFANKGKRFGCLGGAKEYIER